MKDKEIPTITEKADDRDNQKGNVGAGSVSEKKSKENVRENKEKPAKKSGGASVLKVLQKVFIVGIVVCVIILGWQYWNRMRAKSIFEDLQSRSTESEQSEDNGDTSENVTKVSDIVDDAQKDYLAELGIEIPDKSLDWEAMKEQNSDIYAWIYIPGTAVDYPVLQSAESDDYYLKHNLDGSSGYPGCIYTQSVNSKDFTDFTTVLYGHNMKDGTMFKTLHNYSDQDFFDSNRYIYVYTPEKVLVYKIFAAVRFGNGNVMLDYDMDSEAGRASYINDLRNNRNMSDTIDSSVTVTTDSHIITLSTCLDDSSQSRWLVNGVLVEQ